METNLKKDFRRYPRILLVDDDAVLRQEFVECFEDYGVAEAASGEEAIGLLQKPNEIDLVMLDVRMSGMNGIEVLEKIKKIAPNIRVVIFTGYGSKDIAIEALRSRADDYLEKPLDVKVAKETIEKLLSDKERKDYSHTPEDKIKRVKVYLLRNFHKKVTLKDAAGAVYLSPKYLSRLFKEYAKIGFNEYKLVLRIEQAKRFLQKTANTIDQISDQLGYKNAESFIRQFKKLVKLTPSEYRKRVQKTKAKKHGK